jgi:hypothetical protein
MEKPRYHDLPRDRMRLRHKPKPLLTSSFTAKLLALCLLVLLGVLLYDHVDGEQSHAPLGRLHRS